MPVPSTARSTASGRGRAQSKKCGTFARAARRVLHPEFFAEVEAADVGIVDDLVGVAFHQHFA
jgi:hypothetical protein